MSLAKRPKLALMDAGAIPIKLANSNLLDFPNKMIANIFDYLDDCTLLKAARVCRRFKNIAGLTVNKRYNGESSEKYYELREYAADDGRQEKLQYLPFLRTFRGEIDAVRVQVSSDHIQRTHWIVVAIEKYCLSVSKLAIMKSVGRKTLYTIDLAEILQNLSKLTKLCLYNADIADEQWASFHYSCLVDIHLYDLKNLNDYILKRFLKNNKQIQDLTVDHTNITVDALDQSNLARCWLFHGRGSKSAMMGQLKSVNIDNLIQIEIPNECGELIEAICLGCKNIVYFKIHDLNSCIVITDHQVQAICSLQHISTLKIAGVQLTVVQVTTIILRLRIMVQFEYQSHYDTLKEYQSIIAATKYHRSLQIMKIGFSKIPEPFTVNADFHKFFIASAKRDMKLVLWDSFKITNAKITKSGKLWYSRDFELRKATTVETNMLQLKDNCFLEIFNELDAQDLWALYRTCNKLRKLLGLYFQEKYNGGKFLIRTRGSLEIIRHFGKYISRVSVEVKEGTSLDSAIIWDAIYKSFGVHLTELIVMGSSIPFDFKNVINNQFVFPALQKLKFDRINGVVINALTSKHSFCPNLQWLEFGCEQLNDDLQLDVNLEFGSNLNNLKTLRFWRYNDYVVNILNALNADVRENLRELMLSNTIECSEYFGFRYQLNNTIVNAIVRFSKLTSLKLILSDFHKANMKYLFENCFKLEEVSMFYDCQIENLMAIEVLNSCVNLRKLQIVVSDELNDKKIHEKVCFQFPCIETHTYDLKSWHELHH